MQSPVVAICAGYTRNAVASRAPLHPNPNFRCARCLGTARPIDGRTVKGVKVDEEKLEAVLERERLVKQAEPLIEKNRL